MTDKAAIKAIRRGDETALALIIGRYAAYIGTVVFNIIGECMAQEDVEETTADVFIALWRNSEKPQDGKLKSWLGAVARNAAKNKLREFCGTLPLDEDFISGFSDDPEHIATQREECQVLRRAIKDMKPTDREIFVRHYYGIQTVSKISESMNMTESAIKLRLSRGRDKLRKSLEEGGYIK